MSLRDQITEDLKNAMRAKDGLTLSTLRLVQAAIKDRDIAHVQKIAVRAVRTERFSPCFRSS